MHLIDINNKVPQGSMKNSNYVRFWCWGRAGQIRVICFAERVANELRHPLLLFEGQGTQGSTIVAMLSNNKTGSLSSLVPQNDVSNPLWTCPSPTLTITSLFMQHKIHDNLQSSLSNFKPLSMNTAATHQPNWISNYSTKTQLPPPPLLQHKRQMNCQIQQEKKRGMKKTNNIYYLQH
jgi:hypothetical protein